MMHIRITFYRPSGKWYDSTEYIGEDLLLGSVDFDQLIRDHTLVHFSEGFIVVEDVGETLSFHNCLYKYDELIY